jgi:hypothetical protein
VAGGPQSAAIANLQAVRVVEQLTRLIDQRQLSLARRLLRSQDVWPRRELAAIRHITTLSARVWGDAGANSVVLAVTLRLAVRRGSPLNTGVDTLFFTLSRNGTPGDWLVTAVATSP